MSQNFTLSIVMMMKNEERYLDKTLSALIPLMNDIKSELIVLDTGSTDSSVSIARKYTDKVYFHEWNNDFAHMRNISLSYAKGQWILVLDADEELIEYGNLKKFFNVEPYNKYNSASIVLRNFYSENKENYSTVSMIRLFKNYKEFKYEGAIHEQPLYKTPTYNNIAVFNHYGYMFVDEEIKQLKDKRNKTILLTEVNKNPDNPYMNYQLGKQYMISNDLHDAIYYMEKAYDKYFKLGYVPIFVTIDLAALYIKVAKLNKCVKLCINYIKKDTLNIDIYYYLGTAQRLLGKFKESNDSYKRYLYLLDNYETTTQANNIQCYGNTVSNSDEGKANILSNYYKLEMYKEVIAQFEEVMELGKNNSDIYFMVIDSLYRTRRLKEIKNYYDVISKTETDKKEFILALEKLVLTIREESKEELFKELEQLSGNYKKLNSIRLGKENNIEVYKQVLQEEREGYYGDIIAYAMADSKDILDLMIDLDASALNNYISYLINNKKVVVLDLYKFITEQSISLDVKKIKVYKAIVRVLLFNGGLLGDKYERLFRLHGAYTYLYLKEIYNSNLSDDDLVRLITDSEDRFILKLKLVEKLKENNEIEYIRKLKELLFEYPQYKKGIQILIDKFQEGLKENNELKQLKKKYKAIIETKINQGNLKEASLMIEEYESMSKTADVEILSMKFIISLFNNQLDDAQKMVNEALFLDLNNFNTVFNIAYLNEVLGNNDEALRFYKKIVNECDDSQILLEANEKIQSIKQNSKSLQGA